MNGLLSGNELIDARSLSVNQVQGFINQESLSTWKIASGGLMRIITSGYTDNMVLSDNFIVWNSDSAHAKSQSLLPGAFAGQEIVIKDAYGSAFTYNITVTGLGCTIDKSATYTLGKGYQSLGLKWDGTSNWMVFNFMLKSDVVFTTYVIKDSDYTIVDDDKYVEVTTAGVTVTLPSVLGREGQEYSIDNSSIGDITLATTSSQLIQGELTQIIPSQSAISVVSNGTSWNFSTSNSTPL